jgi:hypothetical protein
MDITGFGAVFDFGSKVLEKIFPDPAIAANAKIELFKLQQSGDLAQLAADTQITTAQIGVNTAEAGNASVFVSGWRPFVGWIGGLGLAYAAIVEPIARFTASVAFGYHGVFPVLDTTITMQVLFGILGLGAMRSVDKYNGVATK